ncbi:hypothetical protein FIU87_10165 [Bacillus sp. THAF10]|nr:hypothetical protein FIU87_10165 [Bacillus sp. THAF10]
MDAIQFGPLLIKKSYLVLLFSCLLSYLYISVLLIRNSKVLKEIEGYLTSGLLLWILIFKFSIILFRPSILWTNPYGVLFLTGGSKGIYVASIVTFGFLIWKLHQSTIHRKLSAIILLPSIAILLLSYFGIMTVL